VPRYLVETAAATADDRDRATATAARRFPEVGIERVFSAHDGADSRDIWVCRAPSPAHLRRWADACHLAMAALQVIDIEAAQP
jgi:hypothetical protein